MPKEKVKKVTYSIKGKYFSGEQQVSKEGIEVLMSNWKKACANFDEEKLKMASEKGKTTLLTLVQGHGVKGRIQLEGSSPARSMGGAQIVRAIDKFIQSSEEIDEEDEKSLQSALKRMKDMEKTYNPANVSFQNPIYKTVERRTLKVKREEWYGHYRTPDYVKFRKLKNKKLDKDDDKFTDAVPSHWYNKEKGVFEEVTTVEGKTQRVQVKGRPVPESSKERYHDSAVTTLRNAGVTGRTIEILNETDTHVAIKITPPIDGKDTLTLKKGATFGAQ